MRTTFTLIFTFFISLTFLSVASAQDTTPVVADTSEEKLTEVVDILPADAVLLGQQEENGVLALAYFYKTPSGAIGAGQGSDLPYLLFLRFIGAENNVLVAKGLVAYKLENGNGHITPAIKMDPKSGYFVAALNKSVRGRFTLHVGCKLEDDKKRQYQFTLGY